MVNSLQNKSFFDIADKVIDWFAPHYCLFCQQQSLNQTSLCECCRSTLKRNTDCCPCCALPYTNKELCPSCIELSPALTHIAAPYVYDTEIAAIMHAWKYNKCRYLTPTVANLMLNSSIMDFSYDAVFAAPLHWRRQLHRGFNQSEELLLALRASGGIHTAINATKPFSTDPGPRIQRIRHLPPQAALGRTARLQQMAGAFRVRGNVSNKRVLLIDDVCTTGATGNAMAQALRNAGAKEVHLWCLARTPAS